MKTTKQEIVYLKNFQHDSINFYGFSKINKSEIISKGIE